MTHDWHPVNNDFGTHDHEYDSGAFGAKNGIMVRVETLKKDGEAAVAHYYLKDNKHSKGKCAGQCSGEFSRCWNKANPKNEYRGRLFCGIHFPPKVFDRTIKRKVAWRTKFDFEHLHNQWRYDLDDWHRKAEEILRKIADGETNDPVGLAQMYIEERPEEPTCED